MIKKTVVLFLAAVILCFIPVSAAAESNFAFDGIGAVLGSYHFNNDGSHAWRTPTSHYNEFNPGLTAYFKVKSFPLIDKIGITYILKNSFGVPSVYISAYHEIGNIGQVRFDLAAAIASGYHDKVKIADRFDGLLPVVGIAVIIVRHFEIDFIPAGYIAGDNVANELFFSVRLTGL